MKVLPIAGALGAEIHDIDLSQSLSADALAEIHAAFLAHLVVFFRDQRLSPQQQLTFAREIGEPIEYPQLKGLPECPFITPVVKLEHERHNFGGVWHSDTSYLERPPMASMLYALEVPPCGGDTIFANQYLAYETLSDGLKKTIDGLTAINSSTKAEVSKTREDRLRDAGAEVKALIGEHPVVRTHPETKRKALYVNTGHTVQFKGWTEPESRPLLEHLFVHQVKPEFTCRFRWQPGSLAMWDNRCAQHNPVNDYHGFRRVMHRITLAGDTPYRKPPEIHAAKTCPARQTGLFCKTGPELSLKVTVLGSGTSQGVPAIGCDCAVCRSTDPRDRRTRPSILIELRGEGPRTPFAQAVHSILVDTSTDLRAQALANDVRRIDAILFTHGHADHVLGLDETRRYNQMQKTPIGCYANAGTVADLRRMFSYVFGAPRQLGGGVPQLRLFSIAGAFTMGGVEIVPVPLWHGQLPVLGYRLASFAYMTDCNRIPEESWPLLEGVRVVIIDALRERPHSTHFNVPEALDAVSRMGAERAYFTHICHDLPHAATCARLPEGVQLAYDGLILEIE